VGAMTSHYVSYFVREDAGQLVLPFGCLNQSAIDINEAARQRESIYLRTVDYLECVRDGLVVRLLNQGLAKGIDVLNNFRIFDKPDVLFDLTCGMPAELDLVLFAKPK